MTLVYLALSKLFIWTQPQFHLCAPRTDSGCWIYWTSSFSKSNFSTVHQPISFCKHLDLGKGLKWYWQQKRFFHFVIWCCQIHPGNKVCDVQSLHFLDETYQVASTQPCCHNFLPLSSFQRGFSLCALAESMLLLEVGLMWRNAIYWYKTGGFQNIYVSTSLFSLCLIHFLHPTSTLHTQNCKFSQNNNKRQFFPLWTLWAGVVGGDKRLFWD